MMQRNTKWPQRDAKKKTQNQHKMSQKTGYKESQKATNGMCSLWLFCTLFSGGVLLLYIFFFFF